MTRQQFEKTNWSKGMKAICDGIYNCEIVGVDFENQKIEVRFNPKQVAWVGFDAIEIEQNGTPK